MRRITFSGAIIVLLSMVIATPVSRALDDDAVKAAYYKAMTVSAKANWDALSKGFKPEDGFDPTDPASFKGKFIQVETDNLMGYRFLPGDFKFATTIDGNPVAGKYDSTVAKAIKQIQEKLGRDLGDSDDDGKWTIIAKVQGNKGKLSKKVKTEGTVDGAAVEAEKAEEVDAPIIIIVAAHCGPLAVAKDKGMAKEDGTIGAP